MYKELSSYSPLYMNTGSLNGTTVVLCLQFIFKVYGIYVVSLT